MKTEKADREEQRNKLRAEFFKKFSTSGDWRFRATIAQLKAGAKKAADMQMARERKSA